MRNLLVIVLVLLSAGFTRAQEITPTPPFGDPANQTGCNPPVGEVVFGTEVDAEASQRLWRMFRDDQAARINHETIDWAVLDREDAERQAEALEYLADGRVASAEDFFHAGMLFQHGVCPEHYRLAQALGEQAFLAGHPNGGWLYAVTTDRYLLSIDLPQRFGTQYSDDGERVFLLPVDPATTDEERARYGLPTLAQLIAREDELTAEFFPDTHPSPSGRGERG